MEPTESPATWRCPADTLGPGQTATFDLRVRGRTVRGFLVNHEGGHHAYVNRCPHAGTPLDALPNEFFTEDGRYLICATHGAVFAPGAFQLAVAALRSEPQVTAAFRSGSGVAWHTHDDQELN